MDLKLTLCSEKFTNIVPVNISMWLKEIRYQAECYDEGPLPVSSIPNELTASNLSIYDNVEEEVSARRSSLRRLDLIMEESDDGSSGETRPWAQARTWPERTRPRPLVSRSSEFIAVAEGYRPKDADIIHWAPSDGEVIAKRVSIVGDAIAQDSTETQSQEEVELVTNLLATCEGKVSEDRSRTLSNEIPHRKVCYKCISNGKSFDEDPFGEILNKIQNDISDLEERMLAFELRRTSTESFCSMDDTDFGQPRRHSLSTERITTVKPPLPPGRKRIKGRTPSKRNKSFRKQFLTLLRVLQSIDESNCKRYGMRKCDLDDGYCGGVEENRTEPFPLDIECDTQELLQKVTDSLKVRRKALSNKRDDKGGGTAVEDCNANELHIEEVNTEQPVKSQEIIQAIHRKLQVTSSDTNIKLREDVIIDWENDYDGLSEPVVLEGKSLFRKRYVMNIEGALERAGMHLEIAASKSVRDGSSEDVEDRKSVRFKEVDASESSEVSRSCLEDEEQTQEITPFDDDNVNPDNMSVSSMSDCEDTLTTYSDFESDLNEAIHLGESWCNWEYPDAENKPLQSFGASPESSLPLRKSYSVGQLTSGLKLYGGRSKSVDFFEYSLAEDRHQCLCPVESSASFTSDVIEWIARTRGIIFVEDKYLNDDREEWFTSFDSEGRLYFFDELSNESAWALPNIKASGEKYVIQRSATESAIPKDASEVLLGEGDKKCNRLSSSARSTKTQSMVIEPKVDLSSSEDGKTLSMPRDLTKIYGEIIRSGMLNKTKISENGKKLRKNWAPAFAVLSSSQLLFFKDAKTFHSSKPPNDCLCLNLRGAVIEKGDKISSKKNVYKIVSVDHTEVLIQTDRTSDAEEWFQDISTVIQNFPQDSIESSSLDPNSLSKIGRTKSVKAKSKDGGSMEDLSLNPEERQNKIKAKLRKFFNRRPTVDSLKKKGIWKDEPVFGCSLEQITKNRNPRVPVFVEKCIECIESKEENLKTDGLYRASGNLSQVQKIRLEVDQNNLGIIKEEEDVHVLTGSLKLFFRELKDPLIPFKQLVPALSAINNPKRKEKIKEYRKIIGSLPSPNYDTLKFLLQHLLKVEKYNEFNRMNVNNLAIVFGPTLMWPEQESTNMALDFMQQNLVIECLLREFQEIFT